MSKFADDFTSTVNAKPLDAARDLPGSYPPRANSAKETFTAKYARFVVGAHGAPGLEEVMNMCLRGEAILAQEQWHFTGEGDAVVVIKYLLPLKTSKTAQPEGTAEFPGRRRLKKLAKQE